MITPAALIAIGILLLAFSVFGVEGVYDIHRLRAQRPRRIARAVYGLLAAAFLLLGVSMLVFPGRFE